VVVQLRKAPAGSAAVSRGERLVCSPTENERARSWEIGNGREVEIAASRGEPPLMDDGWREGLILGAFAEFRSARWH
jgi:hypothetical protein